MKQEQYDKIIKGAKYVKEGIPLKDAMDSDEIEEAIILLAVLLKEKNPPSFR